MELNKKQHNKRPAKYVPKGDKSAAKPKYVPGLKKKKLLSEVQQRDRVARTVPKAPWCKSCGKGVMVRRQWNMLTCTSKLCNNTQPEDKC